MGLDYEPNIGGLPLSLEASITKVNELTDGPSIERLATLKGSRVVIRPLTEDDVDALFSIYSDATVTQYMGISLFKDSGDAKAFLADIDAGLQDRTLLEWGVEEIQRHRVIGTCTFSSISWTNQRAEIGFALAPSHWGRGFMAEALPLVIDHAFGPLKLHRLEADVDPRNHRSLKVLERLGFRREGYLQQRHYINNEYQDSVLLGLLADEWAKNDTHRTNRVS